MRISVALLGLVLLLSSPITGRGEDRPGIAPTLLGTDVLADQLVQNLRGRSVLTGRRLAVLPLVDLSDLQTTSDLGRLAAEELAAALHFRNFHLAEIRGDDQLLLSRRVGELALARTGPDRRAASRKAELGELADRYNLGGLVVGTYAVKPPGGASTWPGGDSEGRVALNVRLIDPISGAVLAMGTVKLPLDESLTAMLDRRSTAVPWPSQTIRQKRF